MLVKWGDCIRASVGVSTLLAQVVIEPLFWVCSRAKYPFGSFFLFCLQRGTIHLKSRWSHRYSYQLQFSLKSVEINFGEKWNEPLKAQSFPASWASTSQKNRYQVNFNQTALLSDVFLNTTHKYDSQNRRLDTWGTVFIWHCLHSMNVWPIGENRANGLVRSLINNQL